MKKRLILLSSFLLLSFFMVNNLLAQEKPREASKAKTEMSKKETPSKCASCPSLAKCNNQAAVDAKNDKGKELEGKEEKPVATSEKKKDKGK